MDQQYTTSKIPLKKPNNWLNPKINKDMRLFEIEQNSIIDNVKGIGAVPDNQNVDYLGLKVQMSPSVFLKLAASLKRGKAESADYIKQKLQQGDKIGSPWLQIQVPPEWDKNNFKKPARVVGHEGRNRMYAVMELYGNSPIETHLFFSGGIRNRDISQQWIKELNQKMIPEKISIAVDGPFFII
jgi:hypothetical protein